MGAARKPHDCEPAPSSLWLYAFEALEDFDEFEPVEGDLRRADELANDLMIEEIL